MIAVLTKINPRIYDCEWNKACKIDKNYWDMFMKKCLIEMWR